MGGFVVELSAGGFVSEKAETGEDGLANLIFARILTIDMKTVYFLDRGRQRGISYDLLKEFEKDVNKKLYPKL